MNGRPILRTFFAISPDDAARAALAEGARWAAKSCGGRPTPAELIHLTLVFIGSTRRERVADLVGLMDTLDLPAFDLQLDSIGWFRRNGIVWAGSQSPPDALIALQSTLARDAERVGFSLDVRPYSPHLTLARDAHRSPPATTLTPPLSWRVSSFELMSSQLGGTGPRYEVLHSRSLACDRRAQPTTNESIP